MYEIPSADCIGFVTVLAEGIWCWCDRPGFEEAQLHDEAAAILLWGRELPTGWDTAIADSPDVKIWSLSCAKLHMAPPQTAGRSQNCALSSKVHRLRGCAQHPLRHCRSLFANVEVTVDSIVALF